MNPCFVRWIIIVPLHIPKKILKNKDLIEYYDPSVDDETIEFKTKRPYEIDEDILLLSLKNDGIAYIIIIKSWSEWIYSSIFQTFV